MIGQTISHYQILEKLGEGGMGVVYKARDMNLDRAVALKFLPADFIAPGEQIRRFEQEAKAIAALNHPNIATIYDVGETQGRQYLVLEYLPGGTLKTKLQQLKSEDKEFSIAEVLRFAIQMTEALAHAHRNGIIHRDVKTDNLMLSGEGVVKLTDFGLAKLRGSVKLTRTGTTVGTASYMSPEQVRGEELDHRSDIFSLGVVLYELTTSRLPFRGEFETAITYSILNENPPPATSLRRDVPAALEVIINRCLEKDTAKRYQSADEIVSDLKRIQQEASGTVIKTPRIKKTWWWRAAAVLGLVAAGLYFLLPSSKLPSENAKTIAVLPFTNLSGNTEDEYFTDGIMDDILTQLSKIGELTVISRTTMIQYKGTKKSLKEIAKERNAGIVLEGSVRRSGNRIRISSQLINAETDGHIWADTYDRDIQDVFAIQSDVAQKIASALRVTLTKGEKDRIVKQPTDNTEAYQYCLKAREYYYRYKKQDNETAIELFRKAIALDSNYAIAWAGLSDAYVQRYIRSGLPWRWVDSGMQASMRAVSLDQSSAEAYSALGFVYQEMGFIDKSREACLKAIELNPNYIMALHLVGCGYFTVGDFHNALAWERKAVLVAPTYPNPYAQMGRIFTIIGEYEKAEQVLNKASDLQPDNRDVYSMITDCYLSQGKDREANDLMQKLTASYPGDVTILRRAGYVAAVTGNLAKATEYYRLVADDYAMSGYIVMKEGNRPRTDKVFSDIENRSDNDIRKGVQGGGPEYELAMIYAMRGLREKSHMYLQRAIEKGLRDWRLTQRDPRFENVRNDKEFTTLIGEMKAKVEEEVKLIDAAEKEGNR